MIILEEIEMTTSEVKSFGYLIGSLSRSVEAAPLSCVWSIDSGTAVSVVDSALSSSSASVIVEADEEGCSVVRGLLTFDDDQKVNLFFKFTVADPTC